MRSIQLFLLILVLAFVSGQVFAMGGILPGDGSSGNPYLIEDLDDFEAFSNPLNSGIYWVSGVYTKMMCDINLSSIAYTTAVIAPDTTSLNYSFDGSAFKGSFNGNGFEISNLTINDNNAGNTYVGLFGSVENGTIENLGMVNCSITIGRDNATGTSYIAYIGSLCGKFYRSSINNCYSTGQVNVGLNSTGQVNISEVGGLCGYFEGNMSNSQTSCDVSISGSSNYYASISNIGGLCGVGHLTINSCSATGNVMVDMFKSGRDTTYLNYFLKQVGGLCGTNYANIQKCFSSGSISCSSHSYWFARTYTIGGLLGFNGGTVSNCYSTSSVSASATADYNVAQCDYVAGLMGSSGNVNVITNSYAASVVSGASSGPITSLSGINGLCGYSSGTFNGCFWDTEVSGTTTSAGGTGKTTAEMYTESTFIGAGWDLNPDDGTSVWFMPSGYPKLVWEYPNPVDLEEFATLAQYWGQSGCVQGQPCLAADWYVDGTIDSLDLYQFTMSWLQDQMLISEN